MVEKVIRVLIAIAVAVLLYVLVVWILGVLGIAIPPQVQTIIGVIIALLVLLYLWRTFSGDFNTRL